MANILSESFTGSNGTQINGFNSWVASATGFQIQSNQAAKTDNGSVFAYKNSPGWTGARSGSYKFSRYAGTGLRFVNWLVLGSSDTSSYTNFINNGATCLISRSDIYYSNTGMYVYDGTTLVASKTSGMAWQLDGNEVTMTLTINADGSGSLVATKGGVDITLSWGARTWTKGTGDNHGIAFEHSGNDGSGTLTRSQCNDITVDTVGGGSTFTPKTVVF